jgi:hypothetical protein
MKKTYTTAAAAAMRDVRSQTRAVPERPLRDVDLSVSVACDVGVLTSYPKSPVSPFLAMTKS